MAESVLEIRDRLFPPAKRREHAAAAPPVERTEAPTAFALEDPDSGRVTVSTPLAEVASQADKWVRRLQGRLVEAGRANRNGAFWTQADLEFGLPTVAHGPLNAGHVDQLIVGVLTGAAMAPETANLGPHVRVDAALWRWVNPALTRKIEDHVEAGRAFLSMECVSSQIECTGPNGCGAVMEYADARLRTDRACVHVRERSSHRRFIQPVFLGAGVILPPDEPAWPKATLEATRAAELHVEAASAGLGVDEDEALRILSAIVAWTRRPAA